MLALTLPPSERLEGLMSGLNDPILFVYQETVIASFGYFYLT